MSANLVLFFSLFLSSSLLLFFALLGSSIPLPLLAWILSDREWMKGGPCDWDVKFFRTTLFPSPCERGGLCFGAGNPSDEQGMY